MQAYHKAKHRIFQGCKQAVVNRDDALSRPLLPASVTVSSFGTGKDESLQFALISHKGKPWLAYAQEPLLAVAELKIAGQHNVANALAALALGKAAGLAWEPMLKALREFPGLRHRCQWVRTLDEVSWYNDSKGTNVGATVAAITGLAMNGPVILLAGGVGKGADFSGLAPVMALRGKLAILFGEDAGKLAAVLGKVVKVVHVHSMEEAVQQARQLAESGDVVLLSPACASFDMFNNYEHRGDVFMQAVRDLH
jgi:UDP-N-acetylmuramoylalanine--D-glutamate ligase